MSVKVEVIEGGVPHNKIMIAGLVSTLVCLYLTYLNVLTNTEMFSFFGGLAVVAALIWGSHTIKVLCSYGIGTGVPSAGMIAFGSGVIAMLLATKFGMAAPIVALVLASRHRVHPRVCLKQYPEHEDPGNGPGTYRDGSRRRTFPHGICSSDNRGIHLRRPDYRYRFTLGTVHGDLPEFIHGRLHLSQSHSCLERSQSSTRSTRVWDRAGNRTGCLCLPQNVVS
jgi:hypothetical protein